jgi:hypothetical protein
MFSPFVFFPFVFSSAVTVGVGCRSHYWFPKTIPFSLARVLGQRSLCAGRDVRGS